MRLKEIPGRVLRLSLPVLLLVAPARAGESAPPERPNILFVLTDDQSWLYAGAYGDRATQTPAFDRIAREGVLFQHAYAPSPRCTPTRSAILTGQAIWRLEDGGLFGRTLPAKFDVFTVLLRRAGYMIGWTGKGWGPGDLSSGGWGDRHPLGDAYNTHVMDPPVSQSPIHNYDYATNLERFLAKRREGAPFFFWCGAVQPHREFPSGAGIAAGKNPADARVPGHLPDDPRIVGDILDLCLEVDYFDTQLARMVAVLEREGELENTLIIVTSDNGVALPRCKSTLYDMGTRVPLAVRWPARVPAGRVVEDFVNLVDLAPTFLEVAGIPVPEAMTGRSLVAVLASRAEGRVDLERDCVVTALDGSYPIRAIRTSDYLYVRNFEPSRLPQGPEYIFGPTDDPAFAECNRLSFGRRPPEELYELADDPWQVDNVARDEAHADALAELAGRLDRYLAETGDPRVRGEPLVEELIPITTDNFRWSAFGIGPVELPEEFVRQRNLDELLGRLPSALTDAMNRARRDARLRPLLEGTYAQLAEAALSDHDTERGIRILIEAQAELERAGYEVLAAAGLRDMGRFHGERGELEEATRLLRRGADANDRLGEVAGAVSCRELLAGFLLDAGRIGDALVPLGEAYEAIASGHTVDLQAVVAAHLRRVLRGLAEGEIPPSPELAARLWNLGRAGASSPVPEIVPAEALLAATLECRRALGELDELDNCVDDLLTMEFAGQPPEVRAGLILRAASAAIDAGAGDRLRERLQALDVGSGPCAAHLAAEREALLSGVAVRPEAELLGPLSRPLEGAGPSGIFEPYHSVFEVRARESEIRVRDLLGREDLSFAIEWQPRRVSFHGLVLDTFGAYVGVRHVYRDSSLEEGTDFPVPRASMKPLPAGGKLVVLRNAAVRYE